MLPHESGADILLVGCGKMGGALLSGWAGQPAIGRIVVVEPGYGIMPAHGAGVSRVAEPRDIPAEWHPAAIVLAIKPQLIPEVAAAYAGLAASGSMVLTIAAGKTIGGFEALYGPDASIVRAMPNTPAAVGRGITVCCANARTSGAGRSLATLLMGAVGSVVWVEDEALLDPVTAVSGSGPAYVFLLVEALAKAGVQQGLPPDLAMRLARETVAGTGALLAHSPETPEQLRRNVTSPNGTTQAALDILMAPDGLEPLLERAIEAAAARSRALAG